LFIKAKYCPAGQLAIPWSGAAPQSRFLLLANYFLPPLWVISSPGSDAYFLDTPVVLDGSIDESIDRDCANGGALALLRITRPVFAGIGAEDAVSQYHFVIYREKIVYFPLISM
jgi:hypothetical protein